MRILLQFPEGLKSKAITYQRELEKKGHTVFVSSSPCYGACDIAIDEARAVKADKIVHVGHSKFVHGKLPLKVEYEEYPLEINLALVGSSLAPLKKFRKIALATTVQHIPQLSALKDMLVKSGWKIITGKGSKSQHDGQVLGCDFSGMSSAEKEADCVLYIGGGLFHPLGFEATKPVFALNPFTGELRQLNDELTREKKRETGALIKASEAKTFGIIVSTKPGQLSLSSAEDAKKRLEKKGKTASILISNEINFDALANFNLFEAYINTACPRLRGDYERFGKPVVNIDKLSVLLELLKK